MSARARVTREISFSFLGCATRLVVLSLDILLASGLRRGEDPGCHRENGPSHTCTQLTARLLVRVINYPCVQLAAAYIFGNATPGSRYVAVILVS
jgi:hypothetical protein